MKTRKVTTSSIIWTLLLILLTCLMVNPSAEAQCQSHTPTEMGKNLYADMIPSPERRWFNPSMTYYVQHTAQYWYGNDIAFAKNLWNNSSYKERKE